MAKTKGGEMPFLEHLEELRWRIFWSLLAIALCSGVGIYAVIRLDVMNVLLAPLYSVLAEVSASNPDFVGLMGGGRLAFLDLTEPFFFIIKLGIITGLVLSSPIVAYHVWSFLAPALEDREKRVIVPSLCFGLLLFAGGVALAYFVALPVTIRFLLLFGAEWFTPALTAGYYLSLVTRLLLAFGVVFELPVVIMILSVLGLVTSSFLRSKRRHAIVAIAILASFLSPGDVITVMFLLMAPLIVLYELSILIAQTVERRRAKAEALLGTPPDGAVSFSQ
jgi:sec-independent protein translocase protein TatC